MFFNFSPSNSRSQTPVKSDTEYECEKQKSSDRSGQKWSWTWGELPTPPSNSRPVSSSLKDTQTTQERKNPTPQTNEGMSKGLFDKKKNNNIFIHF